MAAGDALLVHVFQQGQYVLATGIEHGAGVGHGDGPVLVYVGHDLIGHGLVGGGGEHHGFVDLHHLARVITSTRV